MAQTDLVPGCYELAQKGTGNALTVLVRRVLLAALELREGRLRHEEEHRAT
jgi:hypothetical protein